MITLYLAGKESLSFTATAQTSDWLFSCPALTTAAVPAGNYRWAIFGVLAGKTYELLPSGYGSLSDPVIEVVASPIVGNGVDGRTHAEKMLALLEAEIEARITGVGSGHDNYAIEGRSITKIPIERLEVLRTRKAFEVQMERNGGRLPAYDVVHRRPS
jgi:hypothetical protein